MAVFAPQNGDLGVAWAALHGEGGEAVLLASDDDHARRLQTAIGTLGAGFEGTVLSVREWGGLEEALTAVRALYAGYEVDYFGPERRREFWALLSGILSRQGVPAAGLEELGVILESLAALRGSA